MQHEVEIFHRGQTDQAAAWLNGETKGAARGLAVGIGGGVNGRYQLVKRVDPEAPRQVVVESRDPKPLRDALATSPPLLMGGSHDWTILVLEAPDGSTSSTTAKPKSTATAKPKKKRASKKATRGSGAPEGEGVSP